MWDEALLFLVPFWCQNFDAFIVLRWATVAHMGLLFVLPYVHIFRYAVFAIKLWSWLLPFCAKMTSMIYKQIEFNLIFLWVFHVIILLYYCVLSLRKVLRICKFLDLTARWSFFHIGACDCTFATTVWLLAWVGGSGVQTCIVLLIKP